MPFTMLLKPPTYKSNDASKKFAIKGASNATTLESEELKQRKSNWRKMYSLLENAKSFTADQIYSHTNEYKQYLKAPITPFWAQKLLEEWEIGYKDYKFKDSNGKLTRSFHFCQIFNGGFGWNVIQNIS
jgi:hypothetical protein